ncbi:hypothetical protein Palpr_1999 [Paludibacter propionicigenes WB4]|uniref:Uncharacterized protein n=1 Tax=Paludibacter propionicigenes (strain DSM 17365 / JCM 13257 / WB4) TaxID=694427 RepID=E4T5Z2_PALPW|nr:hypothetical protein [Paludibacter propionicigenes]ADQ80136.1 hypothetical protein Palpr_1999 [Paludibacter propionicigenes WB4]
MKSVIKKIAYQFLLIFLVVQTLNLSINSIDFYTPSKITNSADDQDYVDSLIEFLFENGLGFSKDTFHDKAYADNNCKQQQTVVHFDLKWIPDTLVTYELECTQKDVTHFLMRNDEVVNLYYKEVPAKPPQPLSV